VAVRREPGARGDKRCLAPRARACGLRLREASKSGQWKTSRRGQSIRTYHPATSQKPTGSCRCPPAKAHSGPALPDCRPYVQNVASNWYGSVDARYILIGAHGTVFFRLIGDSFRVMDNRGVDQFGQQSGVRQDLSVDARWTFPLHGQARARRANIELFAATHHVCGRT
jgi:hypothetical protein